MPGPELGGYKLGLGVFHKCRVPVPSGSRFQELQGFLRYTDRLMERYPLIFSFNSSDYLKETVELAC